jgi:bifunctional dethiobiotin synthetase / adenosylmethionine---8-amino-7-oxononanoate aminotransferase
LHRSTAVEVALKMAFRKFAADNRLNDDEMARLRVLGLDNAYHGDTLGAMNAVPASPFNGPRQMPW